MHTSANPHLRTCSVLCELSSRCLPVWQPGWLGGPRRGSSLVVSKLKRPVCATFGTVIWAKCNELTWRFNGLTSSLLQEGSLASVFGTTAMCQGFLCRMMLIFQMFPVACWHTFLLWLAGLRPFGPFASATWQQNANKRAPMPLPAVVPDLEWRSVGRFVSFFFCFFLLPVDPAKPVGESFNLVFIVLVCFPFFLLCVLFLLFVIVHLSLNTKLAV